MKHFSGLSASPAVLLPLLHPPTWPFGLPLPQDGCKHPGSTALCSGMTTTKTEKDRQRQTNRERKKEKDKDKNKDR